MKKKGMQIGLFEKRVLTPEAERLLENFEVVAGAPGGVKRLRELVLELAMRGKLVPQDPRDDASTDRHISSNNGAALYELPLTWRWARFSDVASIESCLVDPLKFGHMPHVAPDNIEKATGRLLSYRTIAEDGVTSSKHRFYAGQILYSKIRPNLSKVVLVDFDGLCSADMYPIATKLEHRFLQLFMLSSAFLTQVVRDDNRIAMPKVNQQQLNDTLIAAPPLAEQRRIVAKVDELMKLCDDLEARQAKQRETAARLNRSALDALATAEGPEELAADWETVARNLGVLFTAPEDISNLKGSIIGLAIRGRLGTEACEVNPVASSFAEEADALPVENPPFALPPSWKWRSLSSLVDPDYSISYGVVVPGPETEDGIPFVRVQDLSIRNPPALPSKRIARDIEEKYARTRLVGGELLVGVVGSIGKIGIAPETWKGANIARAVCRIMPRRTVDAAFLAYVLQSDLLQGYFIGSTRTLAQPTLNIGLIKASPVPLPPLPEQKRIVAKVDHLLSLCDTLEQKLRAADESARKVADALVAELLA